MELAPKSNNRKAKIAAMTTAIGVAFGAGVLIESQVGGPRPASSREAARTVEITPRILSVQDPENPGLTLYVNSATGEVESWEGSHSAGNANTTGAKVEVNNGGNTEVPSAVSGNQTLTIGNSENTDQGSPAVTIHN